MTNGEVNNAFLSPEKKAAANVREQHHQQTPTSTRTPPTSDCAQPEQNVSASATTLPAATAGAEEPPPLVLKTSRPNSKLILQNMEEVLNSVKKQHRQKHRRKREQRKLAQQQQQQQQQLQQQQQNHQQQETDGVIYISGEEAIAVGAVPSTNSRRKHKKPLQENGLNHNVKKRERHGNHKHKHAHSPSSTSSSSAAASAAVIASSSSSCQTAGSILSHFSQTPNKHTTESPLEVPKTAAAKSMNAFEVMMNARNKTIGSNTPGKEAPVDSPTAAADEDDAVAVTNAKRKLMLQEWADRAGASKRKLEDEVRGDYVNQKMENRAKRLKKLLEHGGQSRPMTPKDRPMATGTPLSILADKSKENSSSGTAKGRRKSAAKTATGRPRGRPRALRLSSTESMGTAGEIDTPPAMSEEVAEFLAKLASPTKKRDSLLGYFPKKQLSDKEDSQIEFVNVAETTNGQERVETDGGDPMTTINGQASENSSQVEMRTEEMPLTASTRRRTPRRGAKHRQSGLELSDIGTPGTPTAANATPQSSTTRVATPVSTTRPKRSCAGKVRYEYADEMVALTQLPTEHHKKGAKATTRSKTLATAIEGTVEPLNDTDEVIMLLDDSNSELPGNDDSAKAERSAGTSKKLAPLFMRTMPKPSPDPERLKARHNFLMSGVPDKLRHDMAKQKQYEQQLADQFEVFPRVAHVRQYDAECLGLLQSRHTFARNLLDESLDENVGPPGGGQRRSKGGQKERRFRLGSITTCTPALWRALQLQARTPKTSMPPPNALPLIEHKREIIKEWKAQFNGFPTYKCYNQLRGKYHFFSAIDSAQDTEQVTESLVMTRRNSRRSDPNADGGDQDEQAKPPAAAPNGELLFTEKYKPLLFEQVLVNLTPITQLRDFLGSWSNGTSGGRNSQPLDDSLDMLNDSNSSQSSAMQCNTVVLLGPVSSGKTNAVFALANDLNFNVLEINAGMKRTGKKLIQELQEATQSHQIRKESSGKSMSSKSQKNLLKMSLGLKKSKSLVSAGSPASPNPNDASLSNGSDAATVNSTRNGLILIEDADIVFDQTDAGFTDAIYTLAASSKRPVIVVATNPNAPHLQRLMNQHTITFAAAHVLKIAQYLAVLSLLEDCPVNLDDLVSLYLYNRKDLRKTIMELQFFIQSGGDRRRLLATEHGNNNYAVERQRQQYFASPTKRDQTTTNTSEKTDDAGGPLVYLHNTLFELFTVDQNAMHRIPFPVDFRILRPNLTDIFNVSVKLQRTVAPVNKKRKSRSPKKRESTPLEALCQFYENVSVASMLSDHITTKAKGDAPLHYTDRLVPHIEEHIAHDLVEKGISVNLGVKVCPHNLFETPKISTSLCDYMGQTSTATASQRSRVRSLDYEPSLRAICRSERARATLERRSTRFYHYLRNMMVNASSFCTDYFDTACRIFEGDYQQQTDMPNGDGAS